jgi:hypothetical protein
MRGAGMDRKVVAPESAIPWVSFYKILAIKRSDLLMSARLRKEVRKFGELKKNANNEYDGLSLSWIGR